MNSYTITDKCVGCTLCARSCPVKAITGELKGQHTINPEYCIRCGLCGRLCATGAILDENGMPMHKVAKADWKKPKVDTEMCAGCSVCIENCPQHCLTLTDPKFHGDIRTVATLARPDDCIGCGLCSKACPIAVIIMK